MTHDRDAEALYSGALPPNIDPARHGFALCSIPLSLRVRLGAGAARLFARRDTGRGPWTWLSPDEAARIVPRPRDGGWITLGTVFWLPHLHDPEGVPLAEAPLRFAPDALAARLRSAEATLAKGDPERQGYACVYATADVADYRAAPGIVREGRAWLLAQLVAGALRATGLRDGVPVALAPDDWAAPVDFDQSTVGPFTAVRVRHWLPVAAEAAASEPDSVDPPLPPPVQSPVPAGDSVTVDDGAATTSADVAQSKPRRGFVRADEKLAKELMQAVEDEKYTSFHEAAWDNIHRIKRRGTVAEKSLVTRLEAAKKKILDAAKP